MQLLRTCSLDAAASLGLVDKAVFEKQRVHCKPVQVQVRVQGRQVGARRLVVPTSRRPVALARWRQVVAQIRVHGDRQRCQDTHMWRHTRSDTGLRSARNRRYARRYARRAVCFVITS
jgi:hypothetical protein